MSYLIDKLVTRTTYRKIILFILQVRRPGTDRQIFENKVSAPTSEKLWAKPTTKNIKQVKKQITIDKIN